MIENIFWTIIFLVILFFGAKLFYYVNILKVDINVARREAFKKDTSFKEEYKKVKDSNEYGPFNYKYLLYYLLLITPIIVILSMKD